MEKFKEQVIGWFDDASSRGFLIGDGDTPSLPNQIMAGWRLKKGADGTMACFHNLIMEENGSFQVRAEGSTRGRVELRPRAGAVPKPFENTP
jgi:hypothetical protein